MVTFINKLLVPVNCNWQEDMKTVTKAEWRKRVCITHESRFTKVKHMLIYNSIERDKKYTNQTW
jgi:hypothetical protein